MSKIINANKLKTNICNDAKKAKFDKMISIQQNFIKENMKEGSNSVMWIFSDKEYYNNNLERSWHSEFANAAKIIFENKGYIISGIIIKW